MICYIFCKILVETCLGIELYCIANLNKGVFDIISLEILVCKISYYLNGAYRDNSFNSEFWYIGHKKNVHLIHILMSFVGFDTVKYHTFKTHFPEM